ncbi:N-acetylmuramoyl-L-alanine amidase [Streptomyces sp. NBC_01351]|uniref:N-acetylmuramoyl-L-alanine amidase n=1 Tax=Streptomyces sp. NBC_01351 TaxID=2903833 RepID=UPI002E37869C|nr:N-acetylmuramoyl-L-alanine amidase [Streptomyces sp. NBC_01351]
MRGTALAAALGVVAVLGFQGAANGFGTDSPDEAAGARYEATGKTKAPVEGKLQKLALKPKGTGKAVLSQQDTKPFGLLGVSWKDPDATVQGAIEARTRDAESGKWSKWITLEAVKATMDGKRPGLKGATEPVWVGPSDGAEVRVGGGAAELPEGLELNLVDPGAAKPKKKGDLGAAPVAFALPAVDPVPTDPPSVPPSVPGPDSTAPKPDVVLRKDWGADESIVVEGPIYLPAGKVKATFVHHTAVADPYECSESAAMVRSLLKYHVEVNKWRDLGYNFVVDKCGAVFEGRKGGVDQPVNGAHTFGWNGESSGIAVLGDYTHAGASAAALDAVAKVASYKLGQYDGDINGTTKLVAPADNLTNYFGAKYVKGQSYDFKTLSGHRDGFNTQCPGNQLYPQLDTIRKSGPAAKLKITNVNGATPQPGTSVETPGPVSLTWSTSTAAALVTKFELLVDEQVVATTAGTATQASTTLAVGSHQLQIRATTTNGKVSTSLPVTVVAAVKDIKFVPVTPKRLMDTREGLGVPLQKVAGGTSVTLPVTSAGMNNVTAVVLNVTATNPTQASFVSVYPNGTTRAEASNLNFTAGQTIPNLVVVPVVDGKVSFYNHAGTVDLIADITGYFTASGEGATQTSHGPTRLMDTREGLGVAQQKVAGGSAVSLDVPIAGAKAVVLNVTATNPTQGSFVSVYPGGTNETRPGASNLNFTAGQTIPNLVIVPVKDGKVSFYNHLGAVDLIADITGYFSDSTAGSTHTNIGPKRLMDTRAGLGAPEGKVNGGTAVTLPLAGIDGIPATGVTSVVLNVTATEPTQGSFVSVYPGDANETRPGVSNLNFTGGQTIPNLVIVPVKDGKVSFYNHSGGVHLIADITGYFSK